MVLPVIPSHSIVSSLLDSTFSCMHVCVYSACVRVCVHVCMSSRDLCAYLSIQRSIQGGPGVKRTAPDARQVCPRRPLTGKHATIAGNWPATYRETIRTRDTRVYWFYMSCRHLGYITLKSPEAIFTVRTLILSIKQRTQLEYITVKSSEAIFTVRTSIKSIKQRTQLGYITVKSPESIFTVRTSIISIKQPTQLGYITLKSSEAILIDSGNMDFID